MEGKIKAVILTSVILGTVLISLGVAYHKYTEKDLRLISFNETYATWMTMEEVEKLAAECGSSNRHGGFMDITDHQDLSPAGLKVKIPRDFPDQPQHETLVNQLISQVSQQELVDNNNMLSAFHTRYYTTATGRQAAEAIRDKFLEYAAGRSDVQVALFEHTWTQPSVVARLIGKVRPDVVVLVGAHEDSINGGAAGRAPGADDDASGVVCVLEIFRVLMENNFSPEVTLEFMTYSAEEVGLRGSQAIAQAYQGAGTEVYAALQLDMTFFRGTSGNMGVITDFTDGPLTVFLRILIQTYCDIGFTNSQCGYACSDHASWTRAGYAAAFPFETPFGQHNSRIHTSQDLISFLTPAHGAEFAKLGIAFLVELGGVA